MRSPRGCDCRGLCGATWHTSLRDGRSLARLEASTHQLRPSLGTQWDHSQVWGAWAALGMFMSLGPPESRSLEPSDLGARQHEGVGRQHPEPSVQVLPSPDRETKPLQAPGTMHGSKWGRLRWEVLGVDPGLKSLGCCCQMQIPEDRVGKAVGPPGLGLNPRANWTIEAWPFPPFQSFRG